MMQLSTTQSEPPQALTLYLWSLAPKEPIFYRSRRVPVPKGGSVDDSLESEANSQQPLRSTTLLVIHPILNRSATEASSEKPLDSSTLLYVNSISIRSAEKADANKEMTTSTPPTASQSKSSRSVQESIT